MGDAKRRQQQDPDFAREEIYTLHLFEPFSHDYLLGLSFSAAWSGNWPATNRRAQALTALIFAYLHETQPAKIRALERALSAKFSSATTALLQQEKPRFPARFWGRVEFPEAAEGDGFLCSTPGGECYPEGEIFNGPSTVVNALSPENLKLAS